MIEKPSISIKNYNKSYSNNNLFLDLNLDFKKGEFVCILGPNGCGKTTLLKSIGGLISHEGLIRMQSSNISYVSQDPNEMILPWLDINANLIFPLKKEQADLSLLSELLEITQLNDYKSNYPYQLSGGMAQILLVARSLMNKSDIILLDEPFKSLDFEMSRRIQKMILKLWQSYKPTMIMVSHSVEEAISLADKIIVLSQKPASIKKVIEINLSRSRNPNSSDFLKIKKAILNEFFN